MEVCSGAGLSFSIIAVINGLNETQLGRWGAWGEEMISHTARLKQRDSICCFLPPPPPVTPCPPPLPPPASVCLPLPLPTLSSFSPFISLMNSRVCHRDARNVSSLFCSFDFFFLLTVSIQPSARITLTTTFFFLLFFFRSRPIDHLPVVWLFNLPEPIYSHLYKVFIHFARLSLCSQPTRCRCHLHAARKLLTAKSPSPGKVRWEPSTVFAFLPHAND